MIDGVRISFETFSYGDNLRFTRLQTSLLKMQLAQSRIGTKTKLSKKDEEEIVNALDSLDSIMEEQRKIFAKVVKELPQEMFVEGAPSVEDIDFSDPDTYLQLRANAVQSLRSLVDMAMQGMNDEGKA